MDIYYSLKVQYVSRDNTVVTKNVERFNLHYLFSLSVEFGHDIILQCK